MNNYQQTTNISSPILKDWNKDAIIPANPDATPLIIYTSGTTGSPKGVMLTYRNVVFNAIYKMSKHIGCQGLSRFICFTRPGERRIGYVGNPLPGIDIMFGENDEICVRGDNVMKGYYHREQETADIIRDGWLHTGDRGQLDKYGLRITGRIKEIIVTPNGKNINPEELEQEMLHFSKAFLPAIHPTPPQDSKSLKNKVERLFRDILETGRPQ